MKMARPIPRYRRKWRDTHGRHLMARGYYDRDKHFELIATVFRSINVISCSLLRRDAVDWSDVPSGITVGIDIYLAYLGVKSGGCGYFEPCELASVRWHTGTVTNKGRSGRSRVASDQSFL